MLSCDGLKRAGRTASIYAILASPDAKRHIGGMATNASESTSRKDTKHDARVVGRSAATGRFILQPASSKGATITVKEANTAVKSVSSKKK